jgi:hypothetical protein
VILILINSVSEDHLIGELQNMMFINRLIRVGGEGASSAEALPDS